MQEGKSRLLPAVQVVRNRIYEDVKAQLNHTPSLDNAVETWFVARYAYKSEPCKNHLDAYNVATYELGQAFSKWQAEQPELFEQFRFWLIAHSGA